MNFNLQDYLEKNKDKLKKLIYVAIGLVILIIVWILLIGPYFKFIDMEKNLKDIIVDYCESKTNCMPKDGNYKSYTLQKAYDEMIVKNTLYIPNSKKMCDPESSWVRIFNKDGNYKTYVYLKCGMFSSLVDHEGPKLTLNGESEIYATLKSEFKDPGISKVKDNKDGDISINEVKVTGSVDTNKVGDYTLTYYVYDEMKNRGSIERKVHVVSTLKDAIINDTDESNVYKGAEVNNYLVFSGMLWRIVGLNNDGSIKIVTEDGVAALPYGEHKYDESNVVKYLNNVFLSQIHDYGAYLKGDSKFCVDTVTDNNNPTCNELSSPNYVGLLSLIDTKNSTVDGYSYLINNVATWTSNRNSLRPISYRNGFVLDTYVDRITSVRPVVNLKGEDLYLQGGSGTFVNPYKLKDYEYAKSGDSLNTRLVGEYVVYSGNKFVITGLDKDKNIILTSAGPFTSADGGEFIVSYADENELKVLDNNTPGNLGYQLENKILLGIDTNYLVKSKWKLNENNYTKYYNELATKDYESYISIPNGEDLFSGNNGAHIYQNRPYPLANYVEEGDNLFIVVNTLNGFGFKVSSEDHDGLGARIKIVIKKDAKISGGRGIISDPYTLK